MRHNGVTLVELLIVVAVMVILMAITLPAAKTGIESSRIRAAADIVANTILEAQSRAAESQSPTAVTLFASGSSAVQSVGILESSGLNYAGDTTDSRATLLVAGPTGLQTMILDPGAGFVVSAGDRVQFNHQGHRYRVTAKALLPISPTVNAWFFDLDPSPAMPPIQPVKYAYCFYRQPEPSHKPKSVMPGSSCVDLSGSGYGVLDDQWKTGAAVTQDVTIGFTPRGQVSSVRIGTTERIPTEPIYLLVGEVEAVGLRVGTVAENVTRSHSRWVRIDRQGRVSVLTNMWSATLSSLADSREM